VICESNNEEVNMFLINNNIDKMFLLILNRNID